MRTVLTSVGPAALSLIFFAEVGQASSAFADLICSSALCLKVSTIHALWFSYCWLHSLIESSQMPCSFVRMRSAFLAILGAAAATTQLLPGRRAAAKLRELQQRLLALATRPYGHCSVTVYTAVATV